MFHSRGPRRREAPDASGPSLSRLYAIASCAAGLVVLTVGVAVPYGLAKRHLRDALESSVRAPAEGAAEALRIRNEEMRREASRALVALEGLEPTEPQQPTPAKRAPAAARTPDEDPSATISLPGDAELAQAATDLGVLLTIWTWNADEGVLECASAFEPEEDADGMVSGPVPGERMDAPLHPSGTDDATWFVETATPAGLRIDALRPFADAEGRVLGALGATSVRTIDSDLPGLARAASPAEGWSAATLLLEPSGAPYPPALDSPGLAEAADARRPSRRPFAEMAAKEAAGLVEYAAVAPEAGVEDVLAYVEPCGAWGLRVVVRASLSSALAPARRMAWATGLILLLTVAVLALIGAFVGQRTLIEPLASLRRVIGRVGRASWSGRLGWNPCEIALVAAEAERLHERPKDAEAATLEPVGAVHADVPAFASFSRRITRLAGELSGALDRSLARVSATESVAVQVAEACDAARAALAEASAAASAFSCAAIAEANTGETGRGLSHAADALEAALRSALDVAAHAQAVDAQFRSQRDRSERIAELVEQIARIARKTDLLAIAAGIEAVNAGPVGVGFRTVADEIRSLAVDTGRSAGAIREQAASLRDGASATEERLAALLRCAGEASQGVGGAREALASILQEAERLRAVTSADEERARSQRALGDSLLTRLRTLADALEATASDARAQASAGSEAEVALRSAAGAADQMREACVHARSAVERLRERQPPEAV